jgi:hypothetical protein
VKNTYTQNGLDEMKGRLLQHFGDGDTESNGLGKLNLQRSHDSEKSALEASERISEAVRVDSLKKVRRTQSVR